MIDVHSHVQFNAFTDDYEEVIKRAFENGVSAIINAGTKLDSSAKGVEFANRFANLYAIVGIHPHHADKVTNGWLRELEELAKQKKVVGIGEIGMDYYQYQSNGIVDPKKQREVFIEQIKLAHRMKLPLQIHNRHAGEDVIAILKEHTAYLGKKPGMFHCFAGTKKVLEDALSLGFYIGFDGNITYKGLAPGESVTLSDLCVMTPLNRIVLETDAPYLSPIPYRGKRNEPSYIIETAKFVAQLKGVSYQDVVEQTDKNVYTIFNL